MSSGFLQAGRNLPETKTGNKILSYIKEDSFLGEAQG
jgi:hypothetical protein